MIIAINTLTAIPELIQQMNGVSEKDSVESISELSERILRIVRQYDGSEIERSICGNILIDHTEKRVYQEGCHICLTKKEYKLLCFFIENKGRVVSRMSLLKNVWGKNFDTNTNIVDVYVNHLRDKIEKGSGKKFIHTVVGIGYIMADEFETN